MDRRVVQTLDDGARGQHWAVATPINAIRKAKQPIEVIEGTLSR
jgi:hypothetical protein